MNDTKAHKKPKLRFPKFHVGWETKALGKITLVNPSSEKLPDEFIYIDLESVTHGTLIQENYISKSNAPSRARRVLKKGDILFQTVRPYQQNNFYFDLEGVYVASTGYAQLRSDENLRFIYYYLHTRKFLQEVLIKCTGTNYPAINSNDLKEIELRIPIDQEQLKIASFLTSVDEWITNLKAQKEALEKHKKGVMQKIFSQEMRFKDENGNVFPEWEIRNLGEICNITTGKLDANAMKQDGPYRFYTCAKEYYQIDKYAFDTEALLVSGNGANVGYIHYYKGKFNAYQRTYVLDTFTANIMFIKTFLQKELHRRISEEKKAGNTPYIVMGTLSDMPISLPTLDEQQKIASFLSSIDDMIDAKENQIAKAEVWKRGLMQGLFV